MLPPGFVQALVTYAETADNGADEINADFTALYAKIKAGQGKTLVNSAPGGKSFGYQVNTTVEELFAGYAEALRQMSDDGSTGIVATYADFSQLER
jgi:hypothetical protein